MTEIELGDRLTEWRDCSISPEKYAKRQQKILENQKIYSVGFYYSFLNEMGLCGFIADILEEAEGSYLTIPDKINVAIECLSKYKPDLFLKNLRSFLDKFPEE